jgi:outer membrane lipoprotein-sorting protein
MLKTAFITVISGLLMVAAAKEKLSVRDVDSVLSKYREAQGFRAKIKKVVQQEVLGTESSGDGEFYFAKGKLRLEMQEPENTTLVYDGKYVWLESRVDKKTIEVTKIKSRELKKSDSLLAALFDRKDILQTFKLVSAKAEDSVHVFSFKPKDIKKTEIRALEIALKEKDIQRITYKDDRENRVSFQFKDLTREAVPAEHFAYSPPKGANITEM